MGQVIALARLALAAASEPGPQQSLWVRRVIVLVFLCVGIWSGSVIMAALAAAVLTTWRFTERVLVPLGLWRSAYVFGCLAHTTWCHRGGGLVAGAWALMRRSSPPDDAFEFLQARRDKASQLSPEHILATGLLAAARCDHSGARSVLASLERLPDQLSPKALALAREWRCADLAERGEWKQLADLASQPGPTNRQTRFLGAAAARLAGDNPPRILWLRFLWLLAPHRRRTRALFCRAAACTVKPPPRGKQAHRAEPFATDHPDVLQAALELHLEAIAAPANGLSADRLDALARAWDRAAEDVATRDGARHRAAILGASSAPRALEDVLSTVRTELAILVRESGVPLTALSSDSTTLSTTVETIRGELHDALDVAFAGLESRLEQRKPLPPIDEWREFIALQDLYLRCAKLGGMPLRQLAFPDAHHQLCNLAVWLWNDRNEHTIANAVFRWLLDEAIAVGDERAIELQRRNVDA